MNITQAVEFAFKDKLSKGLDHIQSKLGDVDNSIDKTQAKLSKGFNIPNAKGNGLGNIFDQGIQGARNFQMANAESIGAIVDLVPGASGAMSQLAPLLTNPYVAGAAAIAGVGIAAKSAYDDYAIFNKEMAKLNVTAQLSKNELSKLEDQLINIGANSTTPLDDVPKALNKIVSAGMELPDAMKALGPTLQASKAGFTDVETVAAAAVSTMNSAGIKDATKVYDILFATLNKGNVEFTDIANYLPKIVPGALQAGISLEQTAGAFAFLTAQGQTADRATTLLENAFKSLSSPERITAFNKLGVSIFDQAGKMRPIVDISKQLGTQLDGLTDAERIAKLSSLGLDMEAASAFAALAGDTEKLKSAIDFTTNSSGQLAKAVTNSANATDSWLQIQSKLDAAWLRFGKAVAPVFNAIGQGALQVMDWFGRITAEGTFLNDMVSALGWGFGVLGDTLGQLGKLAGFVFGRIKAKWDKLYNFIRPLVVRLAQAFGGLGQMLGGLTSANFDALKSGSKLFQMAFKSNPLEKQKPKPEKPKPKPKPEKPKPKPKPEKPKSPNSEFSLSGDAKYFPQEKGKRIAGGGGASNRTENGNRPIQITIQKIVGIETLSTTNLKQSTFEIEKIVTETIMRAIRDVELVTD